MSRLIYDEEEREYDMLLLAKKYFKVQIKLC